MSAPSQGPRASARPAPFENVLVATDFSSGAARAVARAGRLPVRQGGQISIVHVLADKVPEQVRSSVEGEARRQLEHAAASLLLSTAARERKDVRVSLELVRGRAHVEIVRRARDRGADLIVLGRHGQRPVRDMLLGSTADRVIRAGELPVLVVGRSPGRAYRQPLVAVDLEASSRAVVTTALRVLGPEVTGATLVHAYHVPFEGFITPGASPRAKTRLRREYAEAAGSRLVQLRSSLDDLGMDWRSILVRGEARTAILAEAIRIRADLLAVGTHGREGLSHAVLGSVAEWIIQAAPCDVLVSKPARLSHEVP